MEQIIQQWYNGLTAINSPTSPDILPAGNRVRIAKLICSLPGGLIYPYEKGLKNLMALNNILLKGEWI